MWTLAQSCGALGDTDVELDDARVEPPLPQPATTINATATAKTATDRTPRITPS
jgi:hypothetical protein